MIRYPRCTLVVQYIPFPVIENFTWVYTFVSDDRQEWHPSYGISTGRNLPSSEKNNYGISIVEYMYVIKCYILYIMFMNILFAVVINNLITFVAWNWTPLSYKWDCTDTYSWNIQLWRPSWKSAILMMVWHIISLAM